MNELEQKILDVIGIRSLTLTEISDQLKMTNSEIWQGGLNHLIGTGEIEKLRSDTMTVYRRPSCARDISKSNSIFNSQDTVTPKCTGTQSTLSRDKNNMLQHELGACARKRDSEYPKNPEEVIARAKELDYIMSLKEAAMFLVSYASVGWVNRFGQKIYPEYWHNILFAWKNQQTPEQLANGRKEAARRAAGLPPIDPAELEYEYYEDAQGRKWRKKPDEDEWESVPELITFADGTTALKGVV